MLRVAFLGCAAALLWLGQRQGELPDKDDGMSERFPVDRGHPDAGPPLIQPGPKLKVLKPVVETGKANPCEGVPPAQQLSCPLAGKVTAVAPTAQGVSLLVRRGPPAEQLRNQLLCQISLAAVKPATPAACSFLGPGMSVSVRKRNKSTTAVEILQSPPDEAKVGLLQERVRAAFPAARRER